MLQSELLSRVAAHREWLRTAGDRGSQLDLDGIDLTAIDPDSFLFEQIYLAECGMSGLELKNVDFYGSEFYSCDLSDTCFVGCSFRKATLDYCNFRHARFVRCQFPHTEVYSSCFAECSFDECSFVGIDLTASDLSGTTHHGTDRDGAYIDRADFRAAKGSASKGISTIIRPSIYIGPAADGFLEGRTAIEWLQAHMNEV